MIFSQAKSPKFFVVNLFLITAPLLFGAPAGKHESVRYLGNEACRPCHEEIYDSWAKTKMAQAFEMLAPGVRPERKHRAQFDPQKDYRLSNVCWPCHTTGHGLPGGFTSPKETPAMKGVGCEACHGPGSLYLNTTDKGAPPHPEDLEGTKYRRTASKRCLTCHNGSRPYKDRPPCVYRPGQSPEIHAMSSQDAGAKSRKKTPPSKTE